MRQANGTVDAAKYLSMRFEGGQQIIDGITAIDRSLIFVLVQIGAARSLDRFFILDQGTLQDLILRNHSRVLQQFGGRRPKNWESTHCSYSPEDIPGSEENWELISRRLDRVGEAPVSK